jgi:glycerophosphoryl diester phosphodiesterase
LSAPRLLGHRGAAAERPENTLPSFEHAASIGVDVLETDVHLTADGHIVVSHDEDGQRMSGVARRICDTSLADLRRWDAGRGFVDGAGRMPYAGQGIGVPLLAEILERFPDAHFNIDIKQRRPPMIEPLLALLREHGAEERVTLASFYADVMVDVRRRFGGATVLAQNEVLRLVLAPLALLRRTGVPGQIVQVPTRAGPFDLASRAFIDKCHALGLRVEYWTVNDPHIADVLLHRGADGLITDDPGRLKPLVDRYRPR